MEMDMKDPLPNTVLLISKLESLNANIELISVLFSKMELSKMDMDPSNDMQLP